MSASPGAGFGESLPCSRKVAANAAGVRLPIELCGLCSHTYRLRIALDQGAADIDTACAIALRARGEEGQARAATRGRHRGRSLRVITRGPVAGHFRLCQEARLGLVLLMMEKIRTLCSSNDPNLLLHRRWPSSSRR